MTPSPAEGFSEPTVGRFEPIWVTVPEAMAIHAKQIRTFGGAGGVRDLALLESALERPRNRWAYGARDLAELAAALAFGILTNHPFVDGNKRVAFVSFMLLLRKNGVRFKPSQTEAAWIIISAAAGHTSEAALARWITDRWPG